MRIRIGRWSIVVNMPYIVSNAELDHKCLNQIMDGTYECEYCYPPCKVCKKEDCICNAMANSWMWF